VYSPRITVVVGVEEVVALPIELEEVVKFEVDDIGCVVVNTVVTNVERDADVTTANDNEGDGDGDGDEAEFVEMLSSRIFSSRSSCASITLSF
jgi:hypothetical protein